MYGVGPDSSHRCVRKVSKAVMAGEMQGVVVLYERACPAEVGGCSKVWEAAGVSSWAVTPVSPRQMAYSGPSPKQRPFWISFAGDG